MNFLKRGKLKAFKSNANIKLVYLFLFELIRIQRVLFIQYGDISPVVKFFSDKSFMFFKTVLAILAYPIHDHFQRNSRNIPYVYIQFWYFNCNYIESTDIFWQ